MKVYWSETERKLIVDEILKKWPGAATATKEMINEAQKTALPEYRRRDVKVARTAWLDEALAKASAPPPPPTPTPPPHVASAGESEQPAGKTDHGEWRTHPSYGMDFMFGPWGQPRSDAMSDYLKELSRSIDAQLEQNAILARVADSFASIAGSLRIISIGLPQPPTISPPTPEPEPAPEECPLPAIEKLLQQPAPEPEPPVIQADPEPVAADPEPPVVQPEPDPVPAKKARMAPLPSVLIIGINSRHSERYIEHKLRGKVSTLHTSYKTTLAHLKPLVSPTYGIVPGKYSLVVFMQGSDKNLYNQAQETFPTGSIMWMDGTPQEVAEKLFNTLPHYCDLVHKVPHDQL